eukprot:c6092_g1_i2.p1 GENE.c6092_g1_i2~~c6092_g1_i2.p1  ORF type:complete len:340 (+),score=81.57 c6092_g1_i2:58-1077(+)
MLRILLVSAVLVASTQSKSYDKKQTHKSSASYIPKPLRSDDFHTIAQDPKVHESSTNPLEDLFGGSMKLISDVVSSINLKSWKTPLHPDAVQDRARKPAKHKVHKSDHSWIDGIKSLPDLLSLQAELLAEQSELEIKLSKVRKAINSIQGVFEDSDAPDHSLSPDELEVGEDGVGIQIVTMDIGPDGEVRVRRGSLIDLVNGGEMDGEGDFVEPTDPEEDGGSEVDQETQGSAFELGSFAKLLRSIKKHQQLQQQQQQTPQAPNQDSASETAKSVQSKQTKPLGTKVSGFELDPNALSSLLETMKKKLEEAAPTEANKEPATPKHKHKGNKSSKQAGQK